MRVAFAAAGFAIGLAAWGAAYAEPLAVKTGLWEITSSGSGGPPMPAMPQIPADQLAKLTPAQQQMVQQRMASMQSGGAAAPVRRVCVTEATLRNGFAQPDNTGQCTRTQIGSSAQGADFKVVCTGDHPATGTISYRAQDPQTVVTTVDMTVTSKSGQSFPVHRTMQGKFVSADCGGVAPAN